MLGKAIRDAQNIIYNGREAVRAYFNSVIVWEKPKSPPYLGLSDYTIFLSQRELFKQINVITNLTWMVNQN